MTLSSLAGTIALGILGILMLFVAFKMRWRRLRHPWLWLSGRLAIC